MRYFKYVISIIFFIGMIIAVFQEPKFLVSLTVIIIIVIAIKLKLKKSTNLNCADLSKVNKANVESYETKIAPPPNTTVDTYLQNGNTLCRADNKPLSDEDVEYLRNKSYQIRLNEINHYCDCIKRLFPQNVDKYKLNELEIKFLSQFYSSIIQSNIKPYLFSQRMSDGTINVQYKGCQVGRIRLQGRKHYMQVLKGTQDPEAIYGTINDFISRIPDWIKYIKYLKRT